MAAESILTYKKPGFPKTANSEKSYQTSIEYIGPLSTLTAAEPASNTAWGDYAGRVVSSTLSPIEGTTQAELIVVCEYQYESGTGGTDPGTAAEITLEVEWVMFQRSYYEHPAFAIGYSGTYALTASDISAIEKWKNEDDASQRELYKYKEKESDTTFETLSTNAQKFALGVLLGQESWEDYSPVIRKTTTYLSGPPGASSAGMKNSPPSFAGGPSGYEWRKTADRGVKAGGQTKWERLEEWTGAKVVLSDKTTIYW